jgi:hypothetical protein
MGTIHTMIPCHFHLFSKVKEDLRGHPYDKVEQTASTWMKKECVLLLEDSLVNMFIVDINLWRMVVITVYSRI